jgi:response regulator RpfG family c-di-GMP phosphodiesterase
MPNVVGGDGMHNGGSAVAEIAELAAGGTRWSIGRVLSAAIEHLGLDAAFVSQLADGELVYRAVERGETFGFEVGASMPAVETICHLMVDGDLPNLLPDARRDARVRDLAFTREAGVAAYVGVPVAFSDGSLYGSLCCVGHAPAPALGERDVRFLHVLARLIGDQLELHDLAERTQRLEGEAIAVHALLAALDARDAYTSEHSDAVVELSRTVAARLDLPEHAVAEVGQAALLHDIGKIGIPDSILNKRGPLDSEEWSIMRRHPLIGERIVRSVRSLAHIAPAIRAEHERWDGAGYPDGLAGSSIPLASRIVYACDAYHAMISDRPYRRSIGDAAARDELRRNAGSQFCPDTVAVLLDVL